ncbi:MAG: cell division protein FtsQ [Cloacibacterium sp.]|nr:cell division protein FtsQ [Cloacibacterium sp.]
MKRFNEKEVDSVSVKLNDSKTPVYFIDEKDVKEIVKKYNPTRKIGDINIPELEKKLNQLPAIDSANVYLNLNGKLNLDIKQRVPVFRLNNGRKDFYVDEKGIEFPISKNYSHPCMLVSGDVKRKEYPKLIELVQSIDQDEFSRNFFVGISKEGQNFNLLTNEGNYKVEIGDLDNIEFKVKGFKTFVEKYLVFQDPMKYAKISVKYNNQIVTTLNKGFKGADSLNTYIRTENTPKTVPVAVSKPTVQKQEVVKSAPPKEKKKESIQSKETKKATKPEKKDNKNKK